MVQRCLNAQRQRFRVQQEPKQISQHQWQAIKMKKSDYVSAPKKAHTKKKRKEKNEKQRFFHVRTYVWLVYTFFALKYS